MIRGNNESSSLLDQALILIGESVSLYEYFRYVSSQNDAQKKRALAHYQRTASEEDYSFHTKTSRSNSPRDMVSAIVDSLSYETPERAVTNTRRRYLSVQQTTDPRTYQTECVEEIILHLNSDVRERQNMLLVLPTGAGKTKTAMTAICRYIEQFDQPKHILWVVHQNELCNQAEQSFKENWEKERTVVNQRHVWVNSVYSSGVRLSANMFQGDTPSFTVCTPDSVRFFEDSVQGMEFDLIVIDEAHHGIEEQNALFENVNSKSRLGLTATPSLVADRAMFNHLYSTLVYPKNFQIMSGIKKPHRRFTQDILTELSILSNYARVEKNLQHEIDLLELSGQFDERKAWRDQVPALIAARELVKNLLKESTNVLLFCNGIEQARVIAILLREHNINATTLHGNLSRDEIISRLNEFKHGHFEVLISVDIMREGVDVPKVDGILLLRKGLEESSPMYTQMIGRGLRGTKSGGTEHCTIWHVV
jgi:superfamily II DNA or RNA helicase